MKNQKIWLVLVVGILITCGFYFFGCQDEGLTKPEPTIEYCINPPYNQLCWKMPHDETTKFELAYFQLDSAKQIEFDFFSWQTFIALNWPAKNGSPDTTESIENTEMPRVWESYNTVGDVFPGHDTVSCNHGAKHIVSNFAKINIDDAKDNPFIESTGQPLIDKNGNYTLYDIRINDFEAHWINSMKLNTKAGQEAFTEDVKFPTGIYADKTTKTGGQVGPMELKTSWMILPEGTGTDEYYTVKAHVAIPAADVEGGDSTLCFEATLGLVGMHIIHKTTGPYNGPNGTFPQFWMWSSFEHKNNAPLASNAQDPSIITPPSSNCAVPTDIGNVTYNYFNPDCVTADGSPCPPNTPPVAPYKWQRTPPYATPNLANGYGTQVVRCFDIFSSTQKANELFHEKFATNSVWRNYMLIGTQWQGDSPDYPNPPPTANGNLPRYLSNTTLETYIQTKENGSCIYCHQHAKLSVHPAGDTSIARKSSDFSFLLDFEVEE